MISSCSLLNSCCALTALCSAVVASAFARECALTSAWLVLLFEGPDLQFHRIPSHYPIG